MVKQQNDLMMRKEPTTTIYTDEKRALLIKIGGRTLVADLVLSYVAEDKAIIEDALLVWETIIETTTKYFHNRKQPEYVPKLKVTMN